MSRQSLFSVANFPLPDKGVAGAVFGSGLITAATQRAD
jgi:hypothetical protein